MISAGSLLLSFLVAVGCGVCTVAGEAIGSLLIKAPTALFHKFKKKPQPVKSEDYMLRQDLPL